MNLDLETVKTLAMWALIIIAAVGVLLAIIIKKVVGKIITLAVAAVLVFFCWQQRDHVTSAAGDFQSQACHSTQDLPTFFGITVTMPADLCPSK